MFILSILRLLCYPKKSWLLFSTLSLSNSRRFIMFYLTPQSTWVLNPENPFPLINRNIDKEYKIVINNILTFPYGRWRFYDGTNVFWVPKTEIILYFSNHENHFREKYKGRRISPKYTARLIHV
jgi:hypothetical protein